MPGLVQLRCQIGFEFSKNRKVKISIFPAVDVGFPPASRLPSGVKAGPGKGDHGS
jgi:hypothetical protein